MSALSLQPEAKPWSWRVDPARLEGVVYAVDLEQANQAALQEAQERLEEALVAGAWKLAELDVSRGEGQALYQAELRRLRLEQARAEDRRLGRCGARADDWHRCSRPAGHEGFHEGGGYRWHNGGPEGEAS